MSGCRHIVLICDAELECAQLRHAISQTGWINDIDDVPSGLQALQLLRQLRMKGTPTDLLLIAYDLRQESCLDIIAAVREVPDFGTLPIVVMATALPPEPARQRCYALGVLKVMVKPGNDDGLVRAFSVFRKYLAISRIVPNGRPRMTADDLAILGDG